MWSELPGNAVHLSLSQRHGSTERVFVCTMSLETFVGSTPSVSGIEWHHTEALLCPATFDTRVERGRGELSTCMAKC